MQGAAPGFVTSADGCEIAVYEAGNPRGLECLFIHGFALDHSVWGYQFSDPLLLSRCRLLAIDLRGHGRSGRSERLEDYRRSETWAVDLAAVIEGKGLSRTVLVPWSFGGRMANDYIRYGDRSRIAGINYVAAASISDTDILRPDHELLEKLCSESVSGDDRELVLRKYAGGVCGLEESDAEFQRLYGISRSMPRETLAYLRDRRLDYDNLLACLEVPVLATHGEEDCMFEPEMSRRLARRVKKGRASLYAGAGHAPFMDQPRRFNRELLEFLDCCNSAGLLLSAGS